MQDNLVIVESPAKAKTIGKFLGNDYKVMSSYGHIRDLKSKSFSINTDTFRPEYEIPDEKAQVVSQLRSAAEKAQNVWLASDEDREGEAISWHLAEVLGLDVEKTRRIVFHEITKTAILEAIEHPRTIDLNLVNAQQARRVLDRIVGFKLSPVLWRKVKPGLSAGRVQSVALRLVAEREHEIQNFESRTSYAVVAELVVATPNGNTTTLKAELTRRLATKEEAMDFLKSCVGRHFSIEQVETKAVKHSPAPPFMTSTLQQEAARKLGFSVALTMRIAQQLYEAGHITYMRTDSLNLSSLCINASKKVIADTLGEAYSKPRKFHTKAKGAQEAHEAIRPTYMDQETIKGTQQEQKLYQLIRQRTLASQMADAQFKRTTVVISIDGLSDQLEASHETPVFDGFLRVYREDSDDETVQLASEPLPPLQAGDQLTCKAIVAAERYNQRPPRYNEASLVHKMEELGIGRPSTYAPTISTIQQRGYVERRTSEGGKRQTTVLTLRGKNIKETVRTENYGSEKNKLMPTDIGLVVNEYLLQAFPEIMDYNFTAMVEKDFDAVAEGKKSWERLMKKFYTDFEPQVKQAIDTKNELKVGERILGTDPKSGRQVSVKIGPFGPIAQIGTASDAEKPSFAPLLKTQRLDTLTLDEALQLFALPRLLGNFENDVIKVNTGRFGPYIQLGKLYVSIPKNIDMMAITFDEAVDLIRQKRQQISQSLIRRYDDEDPIIEIRVGRFGPYLACNGKNYHLPKEHTEHPENLTYNMCRKIIESQPEPKTRTTTRRRTTTKK